MRWAAPTPARLAAAAALVVQALIFVQNFPFPWGPPAGGARAGVAMDGLGEVFADLLGVACSRPSLFPTEPSPVLPKSSLL